MKATASSHVSSPEATKELACSRQAPLPHGLSWAGSEQNQRSNWSRSLLCQASVRLASDGGVRALRAGRPTTLRSSRRPAHMRPQHRWMCRRADGDASRAGWPCATRPEILAPVRAGQPGRTPPALAGQADCFPLGPCGDDQQRDDQLGRNEEAAAGTSWASGILS